MTPQASPDAPGADEQSIVQRASGGDQRALEWIARRHNRRLYRLARGVLGNHTDALDILQEAYLCAFRALGQFRGDSTLATWLERIVINKCLAHQRTSRRRRNGMPVMSMESLEGAIGAIADDAEQPDHSVARSQMREILQRKVDELPAALRSVFVLRSVEGSSVEETARCLKISAGTVRIRHFRARRLLREALAKDINAAARDIYDFGDDQCDRVVENVLARLA